MQENQVIILFAFFVSLIFNFIFKFWIKEKKYKVEMWFPGSPPGLLGVPVHWERKPDVGLW